ncbi:hypothetical protein DXG01_012632 [Tephrocybe rancida]|nr:hypothetical protein DXG01_012632 [Tephrocybe rancida]
MPALRIEKSLFAYKGPLAAGARHNEAPQISARIVPKQLETDKEPFYYPCTLEERANYRTPEGKAVTSHQWDVYDFVRTVPSGRVTTYKDVCTSVGGSPRSVGNALRTNPFAPYIPCHRVIASSLFVGGFRGEWGPQHKTGTHCNQKLDLLAAEGVGFTSKGRLLDAASMLWSLTPMIPFPGVEDPQSRFAGPAAKSPAESQDTSSSKQTSSDKLSALPASKSTPNTNRFLRSPIAGSSSSIPNRGYRRSQDASTSLPSFSNADLESSYVWKTNPRGPSLDHSPEKGTPRQRVSFDSDRGSLPTIQSVRQALSRISRGSDPVVTSPAQRSSAYRDSQKDPTDSLTPGSRSPSQSRSRAASPLRLFQQWSAGRHRHRQQNEDPFVPVNPYKFRSQFHLPCFSTISDTHTPRIHTHSQLGAGSPDIPGCAACAPTSAVRDSWTNAWIFLGDTLPREVYLNILLRLPAMYFTRVARIFEDAEVSRPDIQRMIESGGGSGSPFFGAAPSEQVTESRAEYPPTPVLSPTMAAGIGLAAHVGAAATAGPQPPLPFPDEWTAPLVSPALIRFKNSWEAFVDSLVREWKTLNVVSALLLSAILTMFQIPSAADDPVTRTVALLSLICALMSLSYGCMYIVRFGTMRSMFRAAKWAEEARKTDTLIWWNVWVLLSMPAVWMSWAMVLFIASILSFVWRTGSVNDPNDRPPLSPQGALSTRLAVTGVFALGMIYFILIVKTLRSYGTHANSKAWRRRGAVGVDQAPQLRARDADAVVERRGRERQRGASGPRRREETPEPERGLHGAVELNKEGKKERGGLRSILGLGIMGVGAREAEPVIHVDLEKGMV